MKAKCKGGGLTKIKEIFSWFLSFDTNQRLILLSVISIFLSFVTAIPVVFIVAVYAVLNKESRQFMFCDIKNWILPALISFIGIVNPLIIGNYLGAVCAFGIMIPVFILFMFSQYCMTERLYQAVMDVMMVLSIPCVLLAIIQTVLGKTDCERVSASFFNPNLYAYALCLIILVFIYNYCRTSDTRRKTIYVIGGLFNFIAMLMAGCRTAMLAVAVGALVLLMLMQRKRLVICLLIASVVVTAGIIVFPELLRADSILSDFNIRIRILEEAWNGFLTRPVLGSGILGFKFLHLTGRNTIHAHNIVFNLLVDFGIVGTLFFICYIGGIADRIIKNVKQHSHLNVLLLSFLIATAIHSMMDVPLMGGQNAALLAVLLSGIKLYGKESSDGNNDLLTE